MMIFKRTKHLDPRREWIRQQLPKGNEGFVFEDLDGFISIFPKNGNGRERKHLLIEHKWNVIQLPRHQEITFQELHQAMRRGDPTYVGFYLVTFPGIERSGEDDEYEIDFHRNPRVNGIELSWDNLKLFYQGEVKIRSLFE